MESLVSYRLRLRVLCEDFALIARPRSLKEMFAMWKRGLENTEWERVVAIMRYSPIRRRFWSELEVIYAVERVAVYALHEPMLREITFILRNEGDRTLPDFRVWDTIGYLFVYAHDRLDDHTEWSRADDAGEFFWNAVYVNAISPPANISSAPSDIGIRYDELGFRIESPAPPNQGENVNVGEAVEEEEEEEEEDPSEEDPEEDPSEEPGNEPDEGNAHTAMEVDSTPQFPPSMGEEQENDQGEWRDIYPIGEGPPEPNQPDPSNPTNQDVAREEPSQEPTGRSRAREAIRRRARYLRQFVPRGRRGSSSRNPGDAPAP